MTKYGAWYHILITDHLPVSTTIKSTFQKKNLLQTWPISKIVAPISWKGRGLWDHPLSTSATKCPNIQECSYSEATKAYIQVLNTTILKAYLLLQNTENRWGKCIPWEASHLRGGRTIQSWFYKSIHHQKLNNFIKNHTRKQMTTSISLLPCNEPHFFTWAEHNWQ
jgi:hypothetical protein